MADLEGAMRVMNLLESHHKDLASISKPIIWHTDLHLGNIYVSDKDPTQIVSIIDWQSICVGPLFLQATWPQFLKPNDDYIFGAVQPQLPDNFDGLDKAEKELAISTRDDALITKSYELRFSLYGNRYVFRSINLPPIFREIFIRCGETSKEGTVGIRACLAEFYKSWSTIGLTGRCPISFAQEELLKIEQEFQEYRDWYDVQEFAWNYLDTDADGWISPELNFAEIQQRNKLAFDKYMTKMTKYMTPQDARRIWPFLGNV